MTAGVDVGGTKCLAVAIDGDGGIRAERRIATPRGGDALVHALAGMVNELSATVGPPVAVGVGVPGLVDRRGTLRAAPNLPGVHQLALGPQLAERLSVPIVVDNDATCAAWGEHERGAAMGTSHAFLVTLGTGIGGGIVTGGRIERGANGFAGEAGHMVIDADGVPCPCGKRGCWERYASGSGLGRLARDAAVAGRGRVMVELAGGDAEAVRGEHVTRAARGGDADAVAVMAQFGWWVALGIANVVNLLDPQIVVIGGGLVEEGDLLLQPVRRGYRDLVMAAEERPEVPIVAARLGQHAGAIGAGLLARQL